MKNILKFLFIVLPIFTLAQKKLTGYVYSDTNEVLQGATVKLKGTSKNSITDAKGFFELQLPKGNSIIVVSFFGYESQEVVIEEQKEVKVVLEAKVENIKEVLVIGYGEVKKKDATGSITSIKPSDDNVNQAQGIENLIQGRVAGVIVNSQSFEPGAAANIQIRGVNTLSANTQPLYVVDGIIINSGSEKEIDPLTGGNSYLSTQNGLQGINPRDIANLEILKDASATAIYGSRGSNGVILITTKKGKPGKTKFNYFVNTKIGNVTRPIDVLNSTDYALYLNQSRQLKGFAPEYIIDNNGNVTNLLGKQLNGVNWSDEIFKTSVSYTHRLTASGGAENNNYFIALGHLKADGVTPNANVTQSDFSINLYNKLSQKLKLNTKLAITSTKNSGSKGTENLGGTSNSIIRQIVSGAPFSGFSGNYFGDTDNELNNSVDGPNAWINDYDDISKELRGLGAINLEYSINNFLKFKSALGVDYRKKERQIWYGTAIQRGALVNGEAGLSILDRFRYNLDNTLMFNKKFNRNHSINGTVGVIIEDTKTKSTAYQASDFPLKDLRADGISNGNVFQKVSYIETPESLISYIARVNYNLYDKFNFTGTFRSDGSSKFTKENQYSYFPSFAFAYQLNKEKFFEKFSKLNELKLRLGWGQTGNQAINPFQSLALYANTTYSDASGNGIVGYIPAFLENDLLIWETTGQYNAGLDFSFFNKRLTATIDAYHKVTKNLLFQETIPLSSGFGTVFSNKGSLQNQGIELALSADIIKNESLTWNVFGNFSKYKNKIIDLNLAPRQFGSQALSAYLGNQVSNGNTFKTPANIYIEGQQAALFWGFQTNGIINTADELANAPVAFGQAPQLGDVLINDQNGDGLINDSDKTIIGNPNPDFTYGFGSNLTYKDWTLNLFFNGTYGNDIANGNLLNEGYANGSPNNIRQEAYNNAWSVTNPEGTYPRVNYNLVDASGFTDRIIEDGSFLRLSNVTLSYRVPLAKDKVIESLDLSFAANNVLLFTNYSGYDPEVNSFSFDPLRKGLDWQSFPNQKSFTFSLNLSF
jgi:TonB-dependent starch-binding outer membrane protein SusC